MTRRREFVDQLETIIGSRYLIQDNDALMPFLEERRGNFSSQAMAVALPASTTEVSEIVRLCAKHKVSIVPQGGNTGLCGGAVSRENQLIIGLKRLNRIRELDTANFTITVEAGCILANIQEVAAEQDRFFPLSLGAQGSCQIGGNLSTNAGGINVLHYGNTRDLTLGIEAVMPSGEVWNGLTGLRKNNTGYDLKNLLIGAEGTLGIITAAVLKLFPTPRSQSAALIGLNTPEQAIELLSLMREQSGDRLTTFELMPTTIVEFAFKHIAGCHDVFDQKHPWYILAVLSDSSPDVRINELVESCLANALEERVINDAVVACNQQQHNEFLRLREAIVEAQKLEGASVKHDVSIPISKVPEFLQKAEIIVNKMAPGTRICGFGHIGDGNIHYNLSQPVNADGKVFLKQGRKINDAVHELVRSLNGSFSAEHGIGALRLQDMQRFKSPVELTTMRAIRKSLDPLNIMNPGKVLPGA